MVISRTPFRISFFGGGTDYPAWYLREGGAVLSTTIDKYCYLSCRKLPPFFNIRHRVVWSHIETVNTCRDILHPAVREMFGFLGWDDERGLEIHHQGDLPARTGVGSSSSFAVGLIHAIKALQGLQVTKSELASLAIEFEQRVLKENVGSQDQVAAAHGGLNYIEFGSEIRVQPVALNQQRSAQLNSRLMLFYLGMARDSSQLAGQLLASLEQKRYELNRLRALAMEGRDMLLGDGSLDEFGLLLHEAWLLKQSLHAGVSSALVNRVYSLARQHGALGGKLLGAGGTGFLLFYVPEERQPEVLDALSPYLHVPFQFEGEGSVLLYQSPESSPAMLLPEHV